MGTGKGLQAMGLVAGGIASALTITLYATGYTREAASIAVFTSLLGATLGAVRVIAPPRSA